LVDFCDVHLRPAGTRLARFRFDASYVIRFDVFNQFLADDYIKSHLAKERRWFRAHRVEVEGRYPFERAAAFTKDVRKLGLSEDGKSFVDHFRSLITEIGNALGYVRMVRSAGAEYCADAARFVPDFAEAAALAAALAAAPDAAAPDAAAGFSATTRQAAANLAAVVETLARNFAEGRDYLQVLVNVFRKVLTAGDHAHLDNFYTIVPALCLSWVDASLLAKDRMFKQHRTAEAYYTDDGFAVGIAYVLAVLEQSAKFDALHWFDVVKDKLLCDEAALNATLSQRAEKAKAREKRRRAASSAFGFLSSAASKEAAANDDDDDEDDGAALQLSARRIVATKREHELLFFSISGARVFFRRAD